MRRFLQITAAALALSIAFLVSCAPYAADRLKNRIVADPSAAPSARAVALAGRLRVADLHADSLLWGRDLLERHSRGHVDVPRLAQGHVALQGFGVVTRAPLVLNIERNEDDAADVITLLALVQLWPQATWGSFKERALYQARTFQELARRSDGRFAMIRSGADLDTYLAARALDPSLTSGFLAIEGAHVLEGDIQNVDVMFEAGFRMMAPTHYFDTELGGSAHGESKRGLTELGRQMVRAMEARHMIVDVAHASPATIADVLAMAARPVVVSHTGVRGTCDNNRNLTDDQVRAIAANGGLIGIGYWETAVCGRDGRAVARAIRHAVDVAGIAHVGLGSDFDGSVATPFDTTGLATVVDALLAEGFGDEDVARIMGENVLAFLGSNLPAR
ncbi:MAG TPA: membrane dipeptidase [Candidatus Binatia bacterium]|jgi:microsomal dipeptidase-like Zn-dependent dipeptidase|nr:membrane dipeptidase [Candidatus Binatia bacterium]